MNNFVVFEVVSYYEVFLLFLNRDFFLSYLIAALALAMKAGMIFLAPLLALLGTPPCLALDNGLGLTPQMGYNTCKSVPKVELLLLPTNQLHQQASWTPKCLSDVRSFAVCVIN